jgi:hypothetical protein
MDPGMEAPEIISIPFAQDSLRAVGVNRGPGPITISYSLSSQLRATNAPPPCPQNPVFFWQHPLKI